MNYLEIKVGKLAEAKKFLTEFFDTDDGELILGMGWKIRKADESNLLDVLSHGPVIIIYGSDKTFSRIETYFREIGIAA